ncbi:hypothetical protein PNEG_03519 [Pneumocystis murina B123]|uniref:Uncharacterized protein n=1 Tax=Pneumocystis murina (strain B123) TaxID=1069680 RepID=M7PC78_PNEMU|nr:hypothetical protein PNEG_03519 [Pneumocystis murina B123]EMR08079.1 hypothetical protein PNEG_03519 [Pneumocystis murina B123]
MGEKYRDGDFYDTYNISMRSPKYGDVSRYSNYKKEYDEYRDKSKEYERISLKSHNAGCLESFSSSRHDYGVSGSNRSPRFRLRSPSPYSETSRLRNSPDSCHPVSSHSSSSSSFKGFRESNSYGFLNSHKSNGLSYRHSSTTSGNSSAYNQASSGFRNYSGSSLRQYSSGSGYPSSSYRNSSNIFAWEMTTRAFISPIYEQEEDFMRLNEELESLNEKSKTIFKEKRLSMLEWQKLIYKSEREAQNVEFSEKQLEATVNGSLFS